MDFICDRAPEGVSAVRQCSNSRGGNNSLIFAISPQLGRLNCKFVCGSVNREVFLQYFCELSENLPNEPVAIIMDNV